MNQKQFLLELEQICGVKKPVFLDTGDSWDLPDTSLKRVKDLKNIPVIGRYRLLLENSEVSELWFDLEKPEDEPFKSLVALALETVKLIKSFSITQKYIYCKLSGHGIHIQVFISGLRSADQLIAMAKVVHQKLPLSKVHSLGSDSRCLVKHQKIREFGAENGEHYVTLIPIEQLRKARRKKKYPINKKSEDVVYPKIKVFKCTKQLINRIHELEGEFELVQERESYGTEVDYDKEGEIANLYKCPTIKRLAEQAKTTHHLSHAERLAICQTFICFGKQGQDEIHKILSLCIDYNKEYTQWVIDDNKKRGYRPFTCQWIKDHVGCPSDCKGSGGKSPFKFAWGAIPLEDVLNGYEKVLVLHPDDRELLEVCMAVMLDARMEGDLAWLFLVAPSSSGKTVIINSLHNPQWSIKKDFITDKTLVSGKTYKDKATGEEIPVEGLLPKLNGKTLLIKEFTTQLMHGEGMRNAIFGQLRAIYDEEYDVAFGSFDCAKMPESWKHVRMGLLAGCTPFIDRYSTLNIILGERYLKIRMHEPDRIKASIRAAKHSFTFKKDVGRLRRKVIRFLSNIEIPKQANISDHHLIRVANLAEAIVLTRKPVTVRDSTLGVKTYEYDDQTELSTRLVQQLIRLGSMIAAVRKTEWDEEVLKTIVRVAFDTLIPSRAAILRYLHLERSPVSEGTIRTELGWGHHRIRNHLNKMVFINAVIKNENEEYKLNPTIRKHLNIVRYPRTSGTRLMTSETINKKHIVPILKAPNNVGIEDFTVEGAYAVVEDYDLNDVNLRMNYLVWQAHQAFSTQCIKCLQKHKPQFCVKCFRRGYPIAVVG